MQSADSIQGQSDEAIDRIVGNVIQSKNTIDNGMREPVNSKKKQPEIFRNALIFFHNAKHILLKFVGFPFVNSSKSTFV